MLPLLSIILINILKKLLLKYHNYFIGTAIILLSIAFSIRSNEGKVSLILADYPIVIFLLGIISFFLIVIYIQTNKRKITALSNKIKDYSSNKNVENNFLLNQLTNRQKEIYDLIIAGKTNKEIITELFIEHSTLKTHINQIYKKLNVKSRSELKFKSKS